MGETGFNDETLRNQLIQATGKELEHVSSNSIASISDQLKIIRQSLTDFQHVSSEIHSMKSSSSEITGKIDEVSASTDESSKKLIDVVTRMKDLEQDVGNINDLVKVINSIAEQTNLLALNATIEAARAGEAGKGFAVVASEVKELSKTTKIANEKIQQTLQKISDSTRLLSGSVETTAANMTDSLGMVQEARGAVFELDEKTTSFLSLATELTENFKSLGSTSEKVENEVSELKTIGETISSLIQVMKSQGLFQDNFCPLERLGPIVESSTFKNPQRFTRVEEEYVLQEDDVLISATDAKGVITFANNTFYDIAQYEYGSLVGKPHNIIRHKDMPKTAFADLWAVIGDGNLWQGYVLNRGKLGRVYWVKANVFPCISNGKVTGYISVRTKPARDKIEVAKSAYRLVK